MKTVLRSMNLGSSVAEFDNSLEQYFVENEAFYALIGDQADIVAGDKGTGKSALYRIIQKRYAEIEELAGVDIVSGFNPVGSPIFQRLVQQPAMTEGQYSSVWKTYFLSLLGNWLLTSYPDNNSENFKSLDRLLRETGLRSKDNKPETIFGKIAGFVQRVLIPQTAEVEMTISETGLPIVTPKLTFGKTKDDDTAEEVRHEEALALLNSCLEETGRSAWIVMDRLDEAFQGFPNVEVPALRALFRTYLDLFAFSHFRLKLFVRRDLFRKIIAGGFVNLSHINARKIEILWDDADLMNLLCRRARDNHQLIKHIGAEDSSDEDLFYKLFPPKVDQAARKPTTWKWMLARIKDGNEIKPPRNLIDLATFAQEEQARMEARTPRQYTGTEPLMTADAVRKSQERLSAQRVTDTLLAEAGPVISPLIEKFRRSKAEHNLETLKGVLGLTDAPLKDAVQQLTEVGFLEELKSTWKVPMLYRDGLDITQGKAFSNEVEDEDE